MEDSTEALQLDSLASLLDANRSALLDIVSGAATQWNRAELASWLSGPYREATEKAPESVRRPHGLAPYRQPAPPARNDAQLRTILGEARELALSAIRGAANGAFQFAVDALEAGNIEQLQASDGSYAFLPVDHARMTLSDRIMSLLAADYLSRPADYDSLLSFCRCCEAPSFSAETRMRGQCSSHSPSGMRLRAFPSPRTRHPTLMGLGRVTG